MACFAVCYRHEIKKIVDKIDKILQLLILITSYFVHY